MELIRRNPGAAVPAPFLISLRMAAFKYERPLWDILLVHEDRWPVPLPVVVCGFTAVGGCYVVAMLARTGRGAKRD